MGRLERVQVITSKALRGSWEKSFIRKQEEQRGTGGTAGTLETRLLSQRAP